MAPLTNKTRDEKKNGSTPFAAQLENEKQRLFPEGKEPVDQAQIAIEIATKAPEDSVITVVSAGPPTVIEVVAEVVGSVPLDEASSEPPPEPIAATPPAEPPPALVESEEDLMKRLDYSKIHVRLYQGAKPDLEHDYAAFTMIVLCAEEHQPELPNFRGKLIHAGFNDTDTPTQQDILVAGSAAEVVFRELVGGGTVLVTCYQGRNRSGLVVGLVLGRRMNGEVALARVRESRPGALTNLTYAELVRRSSTISTPTISSPGVVQQTGEIAAAAIANGPGIVERAVKAVFQRGGKPRGVSARTIKPGVGRGFFGKARADRTPRQPRPRGGR